MLDFSLGFLFRTNWYFYLSKVDLYHRTWLFLEECNKDTFFCIEYIDFSFHAVILFSFFSILYYTSIYNVHLEIYNSSINNMFTHLLKSTYGKCRDRFSTPSNIKTVFNVINPVHNFAKFSASGVWQSPEVLWETLIINYTK